MTFTLDADTIKIIALAESLTRAHVKDCAMMGETLVFIVEGPFMGKMIRRLEQMVKKRVKFVVYSTDIMQFLTNLVYPLEIEKKEEKEGILYITGKDNETRARLIGRNASTLRAIEGIVKRHFPIREIRIVQQ